MPSVTTAEDVSSVRLEVPPGGGYTSGSVSDSSPPVPSASSYDEHATTNAPVRLLIVAGTARPDSNLRSIVSVIQEFAQKTRADMQTLDLASTPLPMMEHGNEAQSSLEAVRRVRELAAWADGYVLVTPEYHGNMSGALKNWFDFLYLELAGKFAGVVAVTGGGYGEMSITAVKNCLAWCHAFTLPFSAAARASDFGADGEVISPRVRDRIGRIVFDVVRYTPQLRATFEAARRLGEGVESGVAGLHAED